MRKSGASRSAAWTALTNDNRLLIYHQGYGGLRRVFTRFHQDLLSQCHWCGCPTPFQTTFLGDSSVFLLQMAGSVTSAPSRWLPPSSSSASASEMPWTRHCPSNTCKNQATAIKHASQPLMSCDLVVPQPGITSFPLHIRCLKWKKSLLAQDTDYSFSLASICLWFSCHILTFPSPKGQPNFAVLFSLGLCLHPPMNPSSQTRPSSLSQPGSFRKELSCHHPGW